MQAYSEQNMSVGCFAALAIVVFVGFLFWLSGGDATSIFGRERDTYVVQFTDVSGLRASAAVLVAGRPVGEVTGTRLITGGTTADVIMEIDREVQIYQNARFTIVRPAIIGAPFIQIDPGTPDAALISFVAGEPPTLASEKEQMRLGFTTDQSDSGAGLDAIMAKSEKLVDELTDMMRTFNQHQEQILVSIDELLASTSRIVQNAEQSLDPERLERMMANMEALSTELRTMAEDNRETIQELLTSIDRTVDTADEQLRARSEEVGELLRGVSETLDARLGPLLDNLNELTGSLDTLVMDNSHNLGETIRNIRATTENLQGFTARIKANPSLLIFGDSEDKAQKLAARERLNQDLRDSGRLPIYDKRE